MVPCLQYFSSLPTHPARRSKKNLQPVRSILLVNEEYLVTLVEMLLLDDINKINNCKKKRWKICIIHLFEKQDWQSPFRCNMLLSCCFFSDDLLLFSFIANECWVAAADFVLLSCRASGLMLLLSFCWATELLSWWAPELLSSWDAELSCPVSWYEGVRKYHSPLSLQ